MMQIPEMARLRLRFENHLFNIKCSTVQISKYITNRATGTSPVSAILKISADGANPVYCRPEINQSYERYVSDVEPNVSIPLVILDIDSGNLILSDIDIEINWR